MLKDILMEVKAMDHISKSALAVKFKQPVEVIEDAFTHLFRMGYLKVDGDANCKNLCHKCPYASACNKEIVKTLLITEKGKQLLARSK